MADQRAPVCVSIATIPSRIAHLRPTLESLMAGELVPDKILVVRPEFCKWENSGYEVPDFLIDPEFCRGIVTPVVAEQDWGSSTKYLGALDHLPGACHFIVADDDVVYSPGFLSGLVEAQRRDSSASYSYHAYHNYGMPIACGCDGVCTWSPYLDEMRAFAERFIVGTALQYDDDFWVAFYLMQRGVDLRGLGHTLGGELVYEQVLPNTVLSGETSADLVRKTIRRSHFFRLLRQADMLLLRKVGVFCGFLVDGLRISAEQLAAKAQRGFRKVARKSVLRSG